MNKRIVKDPDIRREEILDAARRLIGARGWSNTSVAAIIDEVGIAKGTFYHHFRSKSDLLDALVRRLIAEAKPLLDQLLADPELDALGRFHGFFDTMNAWKLRQQDFMIELGRELDADANLRLRERLTRASEAVTVPCLGTVIEQGVEAGVFHTPYPEHAARIVLNVLVAMREPFMDVLQNGPYDATGLDRLQHVHDAHCDAMERVLGAPSGSIRMQTRDSLAAWLQGYAAHRSTPPTSGRTP